MRVSSSKNSSSVSHSLTPFHLLLILFLPPQTLPHLLHTAIEGHQPTEQGRPAGRYLPHHLPGVWGHVQHHHLDSSLPQVAINDQKSPLHHGQTLVLPGHHHVRQSSPHLIFRTKGFTIFLLSSTSDGQPTHPLYTACWSWPTPSPLMWPSSWGWSWSSLPPCSWTEDLSSIGRGHPFNSFHHIDITPEGGSPCIRPGWYGGGLDPDQPPNVKSKDWGHLDWTVYGFDCPQVSCSHFVLNLG